MVRLAAAICAIALAQPAAACRLALVLAVDVSSSVDATEDALQRGGLAAALIAPDVQAAFFASPEPVALLIFEWSGRYNQAVIVDWTNINEPHDLISISGKVSKSRRSHDDFPTAMGYALGFAADQFRRAPECLANTIDVAGDGANNDGFAPAQAYAAFPFDGIVVNGLVVEVEGAGNATDLVPYYRDQVIRGAGAFVESAEGFSDYEAAMRRKLIRELSVRLIGEAGGLGAPPG